MAIEVRIPKEITEYKEKIMFGMSVRQLVCTVLAVVLAVGMGLLLTKVFGMTIDTASYGIILVVLPILAIGFIQREGMPFEQYMRLVLRHRLSGNRLAYETRLLVDDPQYVKPIESEDESFEKRKPESKRKKPHTSAPTGEAVSYFKADKKRRKETRREILRAAKAAGKGGKALQSGKIKAYANGSAAQNSPGGD